jgi:hypothetical protein
MADCYHPKAGFRDIAFDLEGGKIGDMWRMICSGDIEVEIRHIEADDRSGLARIVDRYSFGRKKRPVVNAIESRFLFREGRIVSHDDDCDPRTWATQALGEGPLGALAGHSRFLRSALAHTKLALWVLLHPGRRQRPRKTE